MGTRRREKATAKPPVSREVLDRYAVADPKTWPEVVKRVPEFASRWRPSPESPRWQQPDNG